MIWPVRTQLALTMLIKELAVQVGAIHDYAQQPTSIDHSSSILHQQQEDDDGGLLLSHPRVDPHLLYHLLIRCSHLLED